MIKFKLQEHLDLSPPWVKDIVKIAAVKTRNYGWQDVRSVTISKQQSTFFILPWSIDFDDMVSEGCLAYLEAIERGKSEPWAREAARGRMSELARIEARAHGYMRDPKTGKMALIPTSVHKHFRPGLRGGGLANTKKTHCKRGHEFTEENTMHGLTKIGGPKRTCRTCDLARNREYNKAKRKNKGLKTHCKYGHEFTEENTYVAYRKNGSVKRYCRTCKTEHDHKRYPNKWGMRPKVPPLLTFSSEDERTTGARHAGIKPAMELCVTNL